MRIDQFGLDVAQARDVGADAALYLREPLRSRIEPVEVAVEHQLGSREPHRDFVLGQRLDRIQRFEISVQTADDEEAVSAKGCQLRNGRCPGPVGERATAAR